MILELRCMLCGELFAANTQNLTALGLTAIPKRCPACCDKRARQPGYRQVVERRELAAFDGVAIRLPADRWDETLATGTAPRHARRMILKGSDGGEVCWSGRIDIFDARPTLAEPACVRLMSVRHAESHGAGYASEQFMRACAFARAAGHKTPAINTTIDAANEKRDRPADVALAALWDRAEDLAHRTDMFLPQTEYLALDPTDAAPSKSLILAHGSWKWTVKGFGRQWRDSFDDSRCYWSYGMSSYSRATGRIGTLQRLAIVDAEHPLIIERDGERTEITQ